jgi:hypothetical protein
MQAMSTEQTPETAVRNYLVFLEDPSRLVDPAEVQTLVQQLASATDPIEKLRASSRLQKLREGDRETYRQAFIRSAKAWADANDVRPTSFLELGVDEGTLRSAGFSLKTAGIGARRGGSRSGATLRGPGVRISTVKDAILKQPGDFTLAQIAAASGGSPMTIRKAMDEMIATGDVERIGPTPNWSQPGRAPILFRSTRG